MAGNLISSLIINAVLFSLIFWVLTFLSKYFYSNKYFNAKLNFYECGFKSLTQFQISYNINFLVLILFLLIYDGEFLLLIPFSLNIVISGFKSYLIILYFLVWLYLTLILDFMFNALDWQV